MSKNVATVRSYFNAVMTGNFEAVGKLFADDIIWHQPGKGIQSGIYHGKESVFAHLGNFMKWSNGTFAIDELEYIADNGDFVSAAIHFKAKHGNKILSMKGIDLVKVEDDKIKEVWLFSEKIEDEDDFWSSVSLIVNR